MEVNVKLKMEDYTAQLDFHGELEPGECVDMAEGMEHVLRRCVLTWPQHRRLESTISHYQNNVMPIVKKEDEKEYARQQDVIRRFASIQEVPYTMSEDMYRFVHNNITPF